MRRLPMALLLCLTACCCRAQSVRDAPVFETAAHYGFVWKHTPKLTVRTGAPLWGQEWTALLQTRGARPWHHWRNYPAFSLSLGHLNLSEATHGEAWTLTPALNLPLLRANRLEAFFRVGTGIGRVSRPYDYFNNPGQNALGSHWNNHTTFRLYTAWRPALHWRVVAGASLQHLSNGGMSLPNYGLNIPTAFAGVNWSPAVLRRQDFQRWPEQPKRGGRGGGVQVQGGLALVEYSQLDGPRYPIWNLSGSFFYHINRANRWHLGVDYELNKAIYQWGIYANVFKSDAEAQQGATRVAVFVADEFLFGNWGIHLQVGNYTGKGINQYVLRQRYTRISTRYYLPALFSKGPRPYCGVALKAHAAIAESIMLQLGFSSR